MASVGTSLGPLEPARRANAGQASWRVADLSAPALQHFHAAVASAPWGRTRRLLMALTDADARLLSSGACHELAGTLDGCPARIGVVEELVQHVAAGDAHANTLADALLGRALDDGCDVAVAYVPDVLCPLAGPRDPELQDVTWRVTESTRRGAPMAPVRSGERADLAVMAAMPPFGASSARLVVERSPEYLDFLITRLRLHAGLAPSGTRQLLFLVVEEGMRAAAYVVISVVGETWHVELAGDHDPSGARIGAILQTVIAREPAERRPVISTWLQSAPPQVSVVSSTRAPGVLRIRTRDARQRDLRAGDVAVVRGDFA